MTIVEQMAHDIARRLIAVPGWAADLESTIAGLESLRGALVINCADHPGVADPGKAAGAIIRRAGAILRDVATADLEMVLGEYLDLLPEDLRARLLAGAIEVLRDAGATVETFKDEAGETFLRVAGLAPDALGMPADELDRLAGVTPRPVGNLHRVQ